MLLVVEDVITSRWIHFLTSY